MIMNNKFNKLVKKYAYLDEDQKFTSPVSLDQDSNLEYNKKLEEDIDEVINELISKYFT